MQESIPDIRAQSRPYAAAGARGIILAAVLILLGITVALAMQAQVLARSYLILAKAEHTRAQLRAAAADGAWHALNILAADRVMLIDHTNEDWAAPISLRLPDGIAHEVLRGDQLELALLPLLLFTDHLGDLRIYGLKTGHGLFLS